ncbi:MAG: NADH-quinone oxidoreductase subunit M [Bdellovibrionales bacterium]|nr:NADH-quinone oxidoreductase subunit M [Bdellovibrionales bacterium]
MEHLYNLTASGDVVLSLLVFLPLFGALTLFLLPENNDSLARSVSIFFSGAAFLVSLTLLKLFEVGTPQMQFVEKVDWIPSLGVKYLLGVDGLSLWLIVLTTLLSLLVIFASTSITHRLRSYLGCMMLLETGMLGSFVALDGITFYMFYELMLIPMYFLIGVWGGKRKVYAALKFFIYTALGSLLMLVAIVYLGWAHEQQFGRMSFYLGDWVNLRFGFLEEILLFCAFGLAFSIKIPLFPLHTWLPDAHVEAPTGGSVILAGVLLKLGIYGLIRFAMPVFPGAITYLAPAFVVLGVAGIVYGALVAWVQTDIKKLVAYSSVSHLGFCVLGLAALNMKGIQGSVLQMINHGISTGALFFLVGVLYDRKHTRLIADYGGLAQKVPMFAFVFMVFTLSSVGLPLTNGFIGEFLILLGGFQYNPVAGAIAVSGVVLGALYMLSLYRRVIFGSFDEERNGDLSDLNPREKLVFAPLLVLVFLIGLYPQPFLNRIEPTTRAVLDHVRKRTANPTSMVAQYPEWLKVSSGSTAQQLDVIEN